MAVGTTWTNPSTGGAIDLNTNDVLTETVWDAVLSNLKHLGGTTGTQAVRTQKTVDQAVANGSETLITWNSDINDTNNLHDTVTNNTRLTATEAGFYLVLANITTTVVAAGERQLRLKRNGSDIKLQTTLYAPTL